MAPAAKSTGEWNDGTVLDKRQNTYRKMTNVPRPRNTARQGPRKFSTLITAMAAMAVMAMASWASTPSGRPASSSMMQLDMNQRISSGNFMIDPSTNISKAQLQTASRFALGGLSEVTAQIHDNQSKDL